MTVQTNEIFLPGKRDRGSKKSVFSKILQFAKVLKKNTLKIQMLGDLPNKNPILRQSLTKMKNVCWTKRRM